MPASATDPTVRTVDVVGRRVRVHTYGHGDPVTFLHGWGLSPRSYDRPLRALSGLGYRVTAPALPGFGGSHPLRLDRQGLGGVAAHLSCLLDDAPVPGAGARHHLVGHSFGGGVAMRIAATRPDLVASLTLVCPVGGAGDGAVPLLRMAFGAALECPNRWTPRAAADLVGSVSRHPSAVMASGYAAWRADQVHDLHAISGHRIPTRLLFADRDGVVTPGGITAAVFADVEFEVTHGRHSWLLSDPTRFASLVDQHLSTGASPPHPGDLPVVAG